MQSKLNHLNANLDIKWKTDFNKSVIIENMDERDWVRADKDEKDWNFYWISVRKVRAFFHPKNGYKLKKKQILNHFPEFAELTGKHLMVQNFKKYYKKVNKKVLIQPNKVKFKLDAEIIPKTFILPQEFNLFLKEFSNTKHKKWIFKPATSAQGKGIQLINKLSSAKKLKNYFEKDQVSNKKKRIYVISKYIGIFYIS
jgi:tubulin polyglutamylase TTLL1